jgi:guanine deaminase
MTDANAPRTHADWLRLALAEARAGMARGQSPFGCVIVRDDQLIAAGHNEVWERTDPTAHAEIVTLRRAAQALRRIDLSGCILYSTCEPCPMCAAAIHWARIEAVYYGATIADARRGGFNELTLGIAPLYRDGGSPVRLHPGLLQADCVALFDEWLARPDHRAY